MTKQLVRATVPMCPECGAAVHVHEAGGALYRCTNCGGSYGDTFPEPDWGYYDDAVECKWCRKHTYCDICCDCFEYERKRIAKVAKNDS